jgi:SAM-dependent methyltransferase
MCHTQRSPGWAVDAARYDGWFDRPWGAYANAVEHRLLLDSAPSLAGLEVLDAGCGTGRFTARLELRGARVTGIDRDPAALDLARARTAGRLVEGDVHCLPFSDASFSVTFAVTVLEFVEDPARAIAEMARVTARPDGRVVIGSLNPVSPWGRWNRRALRHAPWGAARFRSRDELDQLASRYGTATWRSALYAPRHVPGVERWGSRLDRIGARAAPRLGAFQVVTITLG